MARIQFRRDLKANWVRSNPALGPGEPGYEIDTARLKIGDGVTRWNDLGYYSIDPTPISADVVTVEQLFAHIASRDPHPVWDDMPALTVLFENGLL